MSVAVFVKVFDELFETWMEFFKPHCFPIKSFEHLFHQGNDVRADSQIKLLFAQLAIRIPIPRIESRHVEGQTTGQWHMMLPPKPHLSVVSIIQPGIVASVCVALFRHHL